MRRGDEDWSQRLASRSADDIIQCNEMCAGMTEWDLRDVKNDCANTNKVDRQKRVEADNIFGYTCLLTNTVAINNCSEQNP